MVKSVIKISAVAALLLQGSASACIDHLSVYYTGIVLNNGEVIHSERIEALAVNEQAYIRSCVKTAVESDDSAGIASDTVERCSYKLRCGYTDNAMLFVGYSADGIGLFGDVARVIVFFDTVRVPTDSEKAHALGAELRWLSELGIITISEETIGKAQAATERTTGQYWSSQDTVLAFNEWFDGSGVNGVWGVKGVRGAGCGSGVSYVLPDVRFEPIAEIVALSQPRVAIQRMNTTADMYGLTVRFAPIADNGSVLTIIDLQGHELARRSLGRGATSCIMARSEFSGAASAIGFYVAAVVRGGHTVQSCAVATTGK